MYRLKRIGTWAQPCLTLRDTRNGSDSYFPTLTLASISLCSDSKRCTNLSGQAKQRSTSQSICLSIVPKAFDKFTKHTWRSLYCSLEFSSVCLGMNIISDVDRFCLKPHWVSGIGSSDTCFISLLSSIFANTFPATDRSDIPGQFPHSPLSPLFLYIVIIVAFF